MKNVYMTVLLCATGLVVTNGSFAATATEEQWNQSVTSYPERRPGFKIKNYHASSCKPISGEGEGGQKDYLFSSAYKKAWPCNTIDADSCVYKDIVAHAGSVIGGDRLGYSGPSEKNMKWRCVTDTAIFLYIYDGWRVHGKIPDCANDDYQVFKNKNNVVSYLFDTEKSGDTLYHAVENPSSRVCVTYACAPDHVPSHIVNSDTNSDQIQCVGKCDKCLLYSGRAAIDKEYLNLRKTVKCSNKDYLDKDSSNVGNTDATYGTEYITALNTHMNEQLAANITVARNLYNKQPNNGVFTCNDLGCELTDNVLPVENTNCEYLCTSEGFAVRLDQKAPNGPCPMYFKQEYDTTKKIYVCNFDVQRIQEAANTARTNAETAAQTERNTAIKECAKTLCQGDKNSNEPGINRGTYMDDQPTDRACYCGGEPCIDEKGGTVDGGNGLTYNYCTMKGPRKRCVAGEWRSTGTVVSDEEENGWKRAFNACVANIDNANNDTDASSNAPADSTAANTDTISTLAGRLAKVEDQFGLSKWRTADGKFNTARLASDLTAGVVLGTTGALVTSSVVKKKQVKDGFESLECTVGGQHVGDWGDVFRIDGK